jgi:hypothetical protein
MTSQTDPPSDLTRAIELLAVGAAFDAPANRYAVRLTVAQCQAVFAEFDRLRAGLTEVTAEREQLREHWYRDRDRALAAEIERDAARGALDRVASGKSLVALTEERDRLAGQVQRVETWAADRIGTPIGRPYAIEVRAALNGSDGWVESLAGRVDGEVPS